MFTLEGHPDPVVCLAFSPSGKVLASGDQDGGLNLWEIKRRRIRRSIYLQGAYEGKFAERIASVNYSPDGKFLVTTCGVYPPFVRVWRAGDLALLREWEGGWSAQCAVFLPDNQTVVSAGCGDEPLFLWHLRPEDGLEPVTVKLNGNPRTPQDDEFLECDDGHTSDIFAMACTPDGRIVTGAADNSARLWDIGRQKVVASCRVTAWVRCVAVSPDGKLAALASGRTVYLWDLTSPKSPLRKLKGHTKTVRAVAFHPGGRIVGSGGGDGIVRLWNVSSGTQLQAFDWKLGWIGALAFAPEGDTAAVGGGTCEIVVFDLDVV